MTDLEITRLCAESMFDALEWEQRLFDYDPLHDDAQAMALVKRFGVMLWNDDTAPYKWWAKMPYAAYPINEPITDINRAICECVAKMQEAK